MNTKKSKKKLLIEDNFIVAANNFLNRLSRSTNYLLSGKFERAEKELSFFDKYKLRLEDIKFALGKKIPRFKELYNFFYKNLERRKDIPIHNKYLLAASAISCSLYASLYVKKEEVPKKSILRKILDIFANVFAYFKEKLGGRNFEVVLGGIVVLVVASFLTVVSLIGFKIYKYRRDPNLVENVRKIATVATYFAGVLRVLIKYGLLSDPGMGKFLNADYKSIKDEVVGLFGITGEPMLDIIDTLREKPPSVEDVIKILKPEDLNKD